MSFWKKILPTCERCGEIGGSLAHPCWFCNEFTRFNFGKGQEIYDARSTRSITCEEFRKLAGEWAEQERAKTRKKLGVKR